MFPHEHDYMLKKTLAHEDHSVNDQHIHPICSSAICTQTLKTGLPNADPREDAGGLRREYVLRIPSVS